MTERAPASAEIVPVPIRAEVVPSRPGDAWSDEIRQELYEAYKLTRSAARARRWYLRQVGADAPAPAESTIKDWIRFYAWDERAEAEYRAEYGKLLYETERQSLANYVVALHVEADVLTGAFDDNPMVGALRLKGSEIAQRRHERKVMTMAPKPLEEESGAEAVPRDVGEALANSAMIQRKKDGEL